LILYITFSVPVSFYKADAQGTEKPFLNSGNRVYFVGNSIIHIGHGIVIFLNAIPKWVKVFSRKAK